MPLARGPANSSAVVRSGTAPLSSFTENPAFFPASSPYLASPPLNPPNTRPSGNVQLLAQSPAQHLIPNVYQGTKAGYRPAVLRNKNRG